MKPKNAARLWMVVALVVMSRESDGTAVLDPEQISVAGLGKELETALACFRRVYSYKVTQRDSQGRTCRDLVRVMSCWGRCDSNEIGDWRFPFKKSHHPVCQHEEIRTRPIVLRHCDPGVEPGTEVHMATEAVSCRCQLCKSDFTACEGLRYRGLRSRLY